MAQEKDGFVALFDVLGFSDRVLRGGLDGIDAYIRVVENTIANPGQVRTILFSDTVVLYTMNDGSSAFDSIISTSSAIFHNLIMARVPVRGAISHGRFVRIVYLRLGARPAILRLTLIAQWNPWNSGTHGTRG
jgi:hypothetical protein